jgi:hypothetical protein
MAKGAPLPPGAKAVEDYAVATLTLDTGAVVRLACSWRLHAGEPAVIGAAFHGVEGGAALRNVGRLVLRLRRRPWTAARRGLATLRRTPGAAARPPTGQPGWRRAPGSIRTPSASSTSPGCWTASTNASVTRRGSRRFPQAPAVPKDRGAAVHLDQAVTPQLLQGSIDVHEAQAQRVGEHLLLHGQRKLSPWVWPTSARRAWSSRSKCAQRS